MFLISVNALIASFGFLKQTAIAKLMLHLPSNNMWIAFCFLSSYVSTFFISISIIMLQR